MGPGVGSKDFIRAALRKRPVPSVERQGKDGPPQHLRTVLDIPNPEPSTWSGAALSSSVGQALPAVHMCSTRHSSLLPAEPHGHSRFSSSSPHSPIHTAVLQSCGLSFHKNILFSTQFLSFPNSQPILLRFSLHHQGSLPGYLSWLSSMWLVKVRWDCFLT